MTNAASSKDISFRDRPFKVAEIKNAKDGEPKVRTYTINEFAARVSKARISETRYNAYHFQKAEEKRLGNLAREARANGSIDLANELKAQARSFKTALGNTKDTHAVMPFEFKHDVTYKTLKDDWKQRDNSRITKFSMILLDIESQITADEIHEAFQAYEYVLWPTVSHRADDPRFRAALFLEAPLQLADAEALILRIDAVLPARNAPAKKTQAIDPASLDVGRLMYLPMWLIDHPEPFFCRWNHGALLTADSFELSEAQAQALAARPATVAAAKKALQQSSIANLTRSTTPGVADAKTIVERDGVLYLHPDGELETDTGWIRVSDITGKISNVSCPAHGDTNGSEFVALNNITNRAQLICKHCGTIKLLPTIDEPEEDDGDETPMLWTRKKVSLAEYVKASPKKATSSTLVFEEDPHVIVLNERYLDPLMTKRFPKKGLVLVKSPKGTGKTTMMKTLVQEVRAERRAALQANNSSGTSGGLLPNVVLIGHRVNLLRALCSETDGLNLDFYQDIESEIITNSPFLGISLDSLPRVPTKSMKRTTIIIDESEQVFQHLLADTLKHNGRRTQVLNTLFEILRTAGRVILLDADLTSELSLEVLKLFRGIENVNLDTLLGIVNQYIFEGRKTEMFEDKFHLLALAIEAARDPARKLFISTNYREQGGDVFYTIFKELGRKVLLVSANTGDTEEVQAFLQDPSGESMKYDVIIATPTAQTGISIDNNHFTDVFGFYWQNVGTYLDIDQGMSRVRQVPHHRVWVQEVQHKVEPKSWQEIRTDIMATEKGTRVLCFGEDEEVTKGQRIWAEVQARISALTQQWSQHKAQKFAEHREALGYEMSAVLADKELVARGKGAYELASEIMKPNRADILWETQDIDGQEFARLNAKPRRTQEEHDMLERHRYQQNLGDAFSLDTLKKAVAQNLLFLLRRLDQLMNWEYDEQIAYDTKARERNTIAFTDNTHLAIQSGLYDTLCDAMDLPMSKLLAMARDGAISEKQVEVTEVQLEALARAFEANKTELSRYLKLRIKEPCDPKNYKKVWNGTIGKFFPLIAVRVRDAGERTTKYYIDWGSRDLVLDLFTEK